MTTKADKYIKKARKLRRLKRGKEKLKIAIITLLLAFVACIFLSPIVLTMTNSLMSQSEIKANYGQVFSTDANGGKTYISKQVELKFIPDMVSVSQYYTVLFKSADYLYKFWKSVILVVPIVIFQILVAVAASYGFYRFSGKLKTIIFFTYIILMLMPYQVTLVPNYLVAKGLGIIDTNWAIWLPGIFSPFSVYLITKYMKRIPVSLIEAAEIDGCNDYQVFSKICFPLSKGCMISCGILVFIDYWNMVEQPVIMYKDEADYPLSVFLSKINEGEIGLAFAVATIYMFLPLLIFLYGEDYLVEGISYQGGVKG
ncbi:MAG: carbohydrate ABC transporter permease [Lachnospiraceae bacterium]|nr:carbohydrate ABC transporter permease [Lachnospiraceae bacterium]